MSVRNPIEGEYSVSIGGPGPRTPKEQDKTIDEDELMRKLEEKVSALIDEKLSDLDFGQVVRNILETDKQSQNTVADTMRIHITETQQYNSKIFEVQSAATGDGVYNCYEQRLDATEWADTAGDDKLDDKDAVSVEVLNLLENDPVSSYTPALGKYDRIRAWLINDDEGNSRWAGVPLVSAVRWVKATENGPATAIASTTITCNLWLNNGAEATSGQLGYHIEVAAEDCEGSPDWDEVVPTIKSGNYYPAHNEQGTWAFAFAFTIMDICT